MSEIVDPIDTGITRLKARAEEVSELVEQLTELHRQDFA